MKPEYTKGYDAGYKAGYAKGKREVAAVNRKLDQILIDPSYEGGVQFWIQKHDALLASFGHLLETPPPTVITTST